MEIRERLDQCGPFRHVAAARRASPATQKIGPPRPDRSARRRTPGPPSASHVARTSGGQWHAATAREGGRNDVHEAREPSPAVRRKISQAIGALCAARNSGNDPLVAQSARGRAALGRTRARATSTATRDDRRAAAARASETADRAAPVAPRVDPDRRALNSMRGRGATPAESPPDRPACARERRPTPCCALSANRCARRQPGLPDACLQKGGASPPARAPLPASTPRP